MLNVTLIPAIALACAAIWLLRSQRGAIAFVAEPRFGILDLKAGAADSIVAEDTEALTAVFGTPAQSTGAAPRCDVLFVCCDIDADGQVRNSRGTLRDFVRDSGATVVVV